MSDTPNIPASVLASLAAKVHTQPSLVFAMKLIKEGQGYRDHVYLDSLGYPTIGYGHLLLQHEMGLLLTVTEEEAQVLLLHDLASAFEQFEAYWDKAIPFLNPERKAVLIDLTYNMGRRVRSFKKMAEAIHNKEWFKAATELMDSLYAKQVGNRAKRNACILRDGRMYTKANQNWQ